MTAFQIQVTGLLDGSTLAAPSVPSSAVEGGVRKITIAGNAGIFDLQDLIGWPGPLLLSHYAIEPAELTRAIRTQLDVPGQANDSLLIPNQVDPAAAVTMWPYGPTSKAYLPSGARLIIDTDDTDGSFSGDPVAGPHFIFLDLQPLQTDGAIARAEKYTNLVASKNDAMSEVFVSFQEVAADLVVDMALVDFPSLDIGHQWMVSKVSVQLGDAAAAGESMVITLERIANVSGAATLIADTTLNNASPAANTMVELDMDNENEQGTNFLARGDRLRLTRDYTAGMAPTPMTNTLVKVTLSPVRM